ATQPTGWFSFQHLPSSLDINLIAPRYNDPVKNVADPVGGDDLGRLGYPQGKVTKKKYSITYLQQGWGGFQYKITLQWKFTSPHTVEGAWTISTATPQKRFLDDDAYIQRELQKGFGVHLSSHMAWWKSFWSRSALKIPDPVLEKQWYLEQYKFGSTSRKGAPPISLQAIWTADNGRIPPWKGDYHHDLNTQLSYWPAYSGNHLGEAIAYLDHLDQNKANYKRYTKLFFGVEGLAVPGVTTLNGTEMGGWIQYSLSPTVSSWLSHHYYLHWRYSQDTVFLRRRAYPWIKEVALFLEQVTRINERGIRQLPISSSPEINDNDLSAWFTDNTNYDIALMKFNFSAAKELAAVLGLKREAAHWDSILHEFPDFSLSANQELMFAPTLEYKVSHRHFSHLMAIHPLGLIRWENGKQDQAIIQRTIAYSTVLVPTTGVGIPMRGKLI
ncbi:MAG: glycosyl hydrolase family 95 catalytic domain-containing protein, partial [Chitinophagaceae bacterium]